MPMNVKHSVSVAVLMGLLAWSAPSMADEAMDLLAKMRSAVHTLSYTGTLVYAQGNELTTYQISHTQAGGAEKESVTRLDQGGAGAPGAAESFSLAKFQQVQPQMEQVYSLDFGGDEFVANRACRIVVARPRDRMRYLQRYCIDPTNGMLLKYSLVDRNHESVEQLMFTALDISQGAPSPEMLNKASVAPAPVAADVAPMPEVTDDAGWSFSSLPAGFQQTQRLMQEGSNGRAPVRQLILSDGMTSVSVFIAQQDDPGALESVELSAGAMNIFTAEVDKHKVTLVGEVPVATLRSISEGLHHAR